MFITILPQIQGWSKQPGLWVCVTLCDKGREQAMAGRGSSVGRGLQTVPDVTTMGSGCQVARPETDHFDLPAGHALHLRHGLADRERQHYRQRAYRREGRNV